MSVFARLFMHQGIKVRNQYQLTIFTIKELRLKKQTSKILIEINQQKLAICIYTHTTESLIDRDMT